MQKIRPKHHRFSRANRARRRNAKLHSTGPRTVEGKKRSAMNASKHNLCSKQDLQLSSGHQRARDRLKESLEAQMQVEGEAERYLVACLSNELYKGQLASEVEMANIQERLATCTQTPEIEDLREKYQQIELRQVALLDALIAIRERTQHSSLTFADTIDLREALAILSSSALELCDRERDVCTATNALADEIAFAEKWLNDRPDISLVVAGYWGKRILSLVDAMEAVKARLKGKEEQLTQAALIQASVPDERTQRLLARYQRESQRSAQGYIHILRELKEYGS